jgi:hypothetical protein
VQDFPAFHYIQAYWSQISLQQYNLLQLSYIAESSKEPQRFKVGTFYPKTKMSGLYPTENGPQPNWDLVALTSWIKVQSSRSLLHDILPQVEYD